MKLFIDSAEISEIEAAAKTGLIDGVTTNPSLVAKAGQPFETLLLLRGLSLDEYLQIIIARVLTESDSVKFASNSLSEQEHLILIEQLREIIQLSSPIDISHV